jgi:hypothetical protein
MGEPSIGLERTGMTNDRDSNAAHSGQWGRVFLAWAAVIGPLAWGVLMTLKTASKLFKAGP